MLSFPRAFFDDGNNDHTPGTPLAVVRLVNVWRSMYYRLRNVTVSDLNAAWCPFLSPCCCSSKQPRPQLGKRGSDLVEWRGDAIGRRLGVSVNPFGPCNEIATSERESTVREFEI
jgi:hypothetical protein